MLKMSIFQEIPERLQKSAVLMSMKKGNILIQKGEKTEYAYYIVSGKVYVQAAFLNGNVYQFSYLEKGEYISDVEVLSGIYRNVSTLIAAEDIQVLKIPVAAFAEELQANKEFLYYVSMHMARKMYSSSYERGQNLFKKGIFKVVLYLIRYYETEAGEKKTVKIRKTRPVIASEIGISIKTLNRSVQQLYKEQQVSIDKGKITINEEQFQTLLTLAEKENLY